MDHLRRLFEAVGFANVETFIASGNVIFDSQARNKKALERKIGTALHEALGYRVDTFIRSTAELAEIARYEPFQRSGTDADGNNLYIAFVASAPGDEAQRKLLAFTNEVDVFHIHGREVYWLVRRKLSESTFSGALLEKTLGMPATMRNSTTVRKLASIYS
jgi:uncharacterized protein (DUF1697 family)